MTPANIAGMAALKELDVIAVTDHNSCKNCSAVIKAAKEYDITVIPGMELTTMEEVHVVCLFETLEDAMKFDDYIYRRLIAFPNNEDIFGQQLIMDEEEHILGKIPELLINATEITFDSVYPLVTKYHGIMIPAHIDKNANSLLANLGFVPPDSKFTCVEVKNLEHLHSIQKSNPYIRDCKVISDSDAHYLEHISEPVNTLYSKSKSVKDILDALS